MDKPFKGRTYVVDFDDLCDATSMEVDCLKGLKDIYEDFTCTLFTIPQKTSDKTIKEVKAVGDWIKLAPHGWWHTRGECLAWNKEKTVKVLERCKDRGIDSSIFRAPAWLLDGEVYEGCLEMGYVVASHKDFRIPNTTAREYVYNDVRMRAKGTRGVHGHLTPVSGNYIGDMDKDGRLAFGGNAKRRRFMFAEDAWVVE